MKKIFYSTERQVSLDGLMTYGKCDNGLRTMDFMCCEDAVMEPLKKLEAQSLVEKDWKPFGMEW